MTSAAERKLPCSEMAIKVLKRAMVIGLPAALRKK
jgi:hypothetical protein